jgi:hypothetical protein
LHKVDLFGKETNMAGTFKGSLHIKVTENVTLEHLHSIIGTIAGMAGCRACGIMGIDLRLSGDPVESKQITSLPGVESVSFGE